MVKKIAKILLKYPLSIANHITLNSYYKYSPVVNVKVDNMISSESKKILVLAPHVDDETIGIGATLIKHVNNEDKVICTYISDGAGSISDKEKEEIIEERKKEAKEIQKTIGINKLYFLDEPDGNVVGNDVLGNKLLEIIKTENPDIIYTPFLIDAHNDHIETTKALIKALKNWNKNFNNIFMYEINCPIIPKLVNSVSVMNKNLYNHKEYLLQIFQSQQVMAFDGFMLLNRTKRFIANKGYGAEVFVKSNVDQLNETNEYLKSIDFSYSQFRQLSNRYNLLLGFVQGYLSKKDLSNKIIKIIN